MKTRLIFLTLLGICNFAAAGRPNQVIVNVKDGKIRGQRIARSYFSFKGIPYAAPPVGDLRFRDPAPLEKWDGIRDTLEHGSFCPNKFGFFGLTQQAGGSEDCLFLNVYTPSLTGKRAVMFWIHGGAFMSGNGDALLYGPEHLMTENVTLVTINHRYSAFGFLSTGDENAPGNQGLKDLVMGLQWVQDNIHLFGGDKNKVTIFGHSAGSVAVNNLMISDLTDGLFQQAILQSGGSLMTCLFQPDPRPSAEMLGNLLGLQFNSTKQLMNKLRNIDYQKIVDAERVLFTMQEPWALRPFDFVPTFDHASPKDTRFFTKTPEEIFRTKKFKNFPMMVGSPNFEAMFFVLFFGNPAVLSYYNENPDFVVPVTFNLQPNTAEFNETITAYQELYFGGQTTGTLEQWLKLYSDAVFRFPSDRAVRYYSDKDPDSPIYYYDFAFDGSLNYFKNFFQFDFEGVSHADELFYIFNQGLPGFIPDANSTLVQKRMTRMWANFAKYGNPTPKIDSLITKLWQPYTNEQQNYMEISLELQNRQHPIRLNTLSDMQQKYTGHY